MIQSLQKTVLYSHLHYLLQLTTMAEKTEKKLTGLQMPLNISPELAKIIGTKKGEQVCTKVR